MDIVYSSSDSYCEIAGISMLSLLEHNKNVKDLNLYLIDNGISDKNKEKDRNNASTLFRSPYYCTFKNPATLLETTAPWIPGH